MSKHEETFEAILGPPPGRPRPVELEDDESPLDDGEPIQNVPPSLADQGHEIVEIKAVGTHHLLRVVRKD